MDWIFRMGQIGVVVIFVISLVWPRFGLVSHQHEGGDEFHIHPSLSLKAGQEHPKDRGHEHSFHPQDLLDHIFQQEPHLTPVDSSGGLHHHSVDQASSPFFTASPPSGIGLASEPLSPSTSLLPILVRPVFMTSRAPPFGV